MGGSLDLYVPPSRPENPALGITDRKIQLAVLQEPFWIVRAR